MLHCFFLLLLAFAAGQGSTSALKQGLLALQAGDLARAQIQLEAAAKQDPANAYVWTSLAETYLRLGKRDEAAGAAGKAEKAGAQNPIVWHALAMFYAQSGEFKTAAQWEQKYAASPHADSDATSRAAILFLRGQDFQDAAAFAENELKKKPRDPQLILTLGVARYGQRRFVDAIDCFLRVIAIAPAIEQPYVFLGKMLDQAGARLPEITRAIEKWQARDPQNGQADLVLAKALLAADPHSAQALQLLRRAIALDPKNWEAHFQLGVLLSSEHQYAEAARELERSIELNPKEPMAHYHLARVYDRLGEPERAKAERDIHQKLSAGTNTGAPMGPP